MSNPVFSKKRTESGVGISGLLAEDGSVFYTQLFAGSHVGKVSDLLVARLKGERLEEVSLRLIIILGLFEASEFAVANENPVSFECGFDSEKMVLGFSFVGNHSSKKLTSGAMDVFMAHLAKVSDEILIRHHENKNRTELIVTIAQGVGVALREHTARITETSFEAQPQADVKVQNYVELGDLDFEKLLAEKFSPVQEPGRAELRDLTVSGAKPEADESMRRFKSEGPESQGGSTEVVKEKPSVMKKILRKVFGSKSSDESIEEKVFKKDQPPTNKAVTQILAELPLEAESEKLKVFESKTTEQVAETLVKGKVDTVSEDEEHVQSESSLQEAFKKITSHAAEVKNELKSEKAKGYVDTLTADLIAEKSRLSELSKKISITVRQKELEFKNKEQAFETELRKKEDLLKQKEVASVRLKEQLTKLSADLDEARNSGRSSEDEARDRTKLAQSQRLLAVTKQENADLLKKVDDMKDQLMQLQQSKAGNKASSEELRALKDKADKAVKQVEEMRKTNQQLLEKLSDKNFERTSNQSSAEDLKRKLEASQKTAANMKKDFDKVSHQFEELRREDLRMKMELGKLKEELKRAKNLANKSGGSSSDAA